MIHDGRERDGVGVSSGIDLFYIYKTEFLKINTNHKLFYKTIDYFSCILVTLQFEVQNAIWLFEDVKNEIFLIKKCGFACSFLCLIW